MLPYWVRHPYGAATDVVPSRSEIKRRIVYGALGSTKGIVALAAIVYGVLGGIYLAGQIPYPAIGDEGYIAYYALSSTQRGALAWFMVGIPLAYLADEKILKILYDPDTNKLVVLDPAGEDLEIWDLGDEVLADMTVEGGELASRSIEDGKAWLATSYDPDENVARTTWEGSHDIDQAYAKKNLLLETITETQDRARDADRLENQQPELVRKSVRHEMKDWVDRMDDIDPIVSGEGYRRAREDVLGIDLETDRPEREAAARRSEIEDRRDEDVLDEDGVDEAAAFGASSNGSEGSE
jgi:hypothetical protein